ncbi:hypothetical protein FOZ62_010095, partial [Perkinsus olseni]
NARGGEVGDFRTDKPETAAFLVAWLVVLDGVLTKPSPTTLSKVKALVEGLLGEGLLGENPITADALNTLVSNLVNNDLTTIDFLARAPVAVVDAVLIVYNGEAGKASARPRLDVLTEEAQARRSLKRKTAEKEVEVFNMATGLKNLQDHVGLLALKAPPELIPQSRFLNKLEEEPYTCVPMSDLQ